MPTGTRAKKRSGEGARRFVLTGASGTLGSRVLERLAGTKGSQVLALLREESQIRVRRKGIEYRRVDFFDREALGRMLREFEPECMIHCAASGVQIPKPKWFDLIRFNVDTTIHMCQCLAERGNCRFVFISTGLAYRETGRPLREDDALDTLHPYGASKAAADLLVRAAAAEFGVPLTVLRPFSFTGINDDGKRLFPALLRAAQEGMPVDLSPGTQVRDHCAVDDVAAGVVKAATGQEPETLGVFNIGSGRDVRLREMVEEVLDELGLKVKVRWGGRSYSHWEPMHLVADVSRARKGLKWEARTALAYAIWELARASFPDLKVRRPKKDA
ncbi:MAG: NAD(P)-dependent oxidoreductase [Chthoniobacteraceae bacterium]